MTIKAIVTNHGWISSKETNFTGSLTSLEIKSWKNKAVQKILIDAGAVQWTKNAQEENQNKWKWVLNSNALVVTHAHCDHAWLVPYFVKKGFWWHIIMTQDTLWQSKLMWEDYIKLTLREIERVKDINHRLAKNLHKALQIKKHYQYVEDVFERNPKMKQSLDYLKKQKKTQSGWIDWVYTEACTLLTKHNVENESDIKQALFPVPRLLFWLEDIEETLKKVEILNIWESKELYQNMPIVSLNDPRISLLPQMVNEWYNTPIEISSKIKTQVVQIYKSMMQNYLEEAKQNRETSRELEALKWSLSKIFIEIKALELISSSKLTPEQKTYLQDGKFALEVHQITSLDDIENLSYTLHTQRFSYDDIKKAITLLKWVFIDENTDYVKNISLEFVDAGHIEWSAQAMITTNIHQVRQILDIKSGKHNKEVTQKEVTFGFSWDLWRIKDPNMAWEPQVNTNKPLAFYQTESTYAGRSHPEKQESIQQLFEEIKSSKGKVIIPSFAMQRTQEILMELIWEKERKIQENKDELWIVKKEKRALLDTLQDTKDLVTKENIEKEISKLSQRQNLLENQLINGDIIVDSPLSEEITKWYYSNIKERYEKLSPSYQRQRFNKEVIAYVAKHWEDAQVGGKIPFESLYKEDRRNKKEIIISASGMAEWWSVIKHLKENLSNSLSKIIFIWYCPPSTLGWKLKSGAPIVEIDGVEYEVKCQIVDIKWFSGHGDEEDIIEHLKRLPLKPWATISFNHGDRSRKEFAQKVEQILREIWKDIEISVPKLWGTQEFILK